MNIEIVFALILNSCIIGDDHLMTCEQFQIGTYQTQQICMNHLAIYKKDLLELEYLECRVQQYEGETK